MKILYHHRTVSKDGMDVHIREMINAFTALGHDVVMVAPELGDVQFGGDGGWVSALRSRLPRFVGELLEYLYNYHAYRHLVRVIKQHKPDAIYERYALFLMAGAWAKRRFRLPMALEINSPLYEERSEHGGLSMRGWANRCERAAWRAADVCLPVSRVLGDMVESAGVPGGRVVVTPNGADSTMFSPQVDARAVRDKYGLNGKLVLGFCGFVRPWHGLDHVIRIMAELSGTADSHLLIVGDGPVRAELASLAKQLNVENQLTFTGIVQRNEIAAHMAAFDIALQPDATAYASPLKLIEYMALGKAIVAPDQPNIRELVENERSALLFDKSQADGMRAALLRAIGDSGLRGRLGAGAAEAVRRRPLSWIANADHVASLLRRHQDSIR